MKGLRTCLSVGAVLLGGCMVGPDYERPDVQVPTEYRHAVNDAVDDSPATQPAIPVATRPVAGDIVTTRPGGDVVAGAEPIDRWWQPLDDPLLDSLIERAVAGNLDLQIAAARVLEARAARQIIAADLFPQVNSTGSYSHLGISRNAQPQPDTPSLAQQVAAGSLSRVGSALSGAGAGAGTTTNPLLTAAASGLINKLQEELTEVDIARSQNLFQAGFDASWEIDVFGGIRRGVQAAEADIEATAENYNAVILTLVSEVARNYVEARGYQKRLAITHQNIGTQRETLELTRVRFKAGLTSELDVAQAAAQLATTQSSLPVLETLLHQAVHRLGVLLGQPPASVLDEMTLEAPIPVVPPTVPVGLPSELLRRRPDIRVVERQLAGQTARIGVAVARLYPRFSITGSFGTQTHDMQYFLDKNSLFWSIGPAVSWPIFQGGRLRGNIKLEEVRQVQALLEYRLTILQALEDVENALVAYRQDRQRYARLADAVAASRRAVELSTERYRKGLADFLSVLESERSLYLAEDQLVQSETDVVADYVALNKALGGGWQSIIETQAEQIAFEVPQGDEAAMTIDD